jgi:hypothetical protein
VVKYLKGRNALTNYLEGDVNVDSDCEGESTGISDEDIKNKGRKWKKKFVRFLSLGHFLRTCAIPPRPHVERNDEFSSWKSLFFYRCTDTILFAPLKSQP